MQEITINVPQLSVFDKCSAVSRIPVFWASGYLMKNLNTIKPKNMGCGTAWLPVGGTKISEIDIFIKYQILLLHFYFQFIYFLYGLKLGYLTRISLSNPYDEENQR